MGLGIREVRKQIAQIESSKLPLRESTKERLALLRAGVRLWEGRK